MFKLTYTSANKITEPKIDAEPELFVANITSATTISGAKSIDGVEQNSKIISLEFSIDYGIPIYRDLSTLTGYFEIDKVEIYLYKFYRKNFPGEAYMEKIHKAQEIKLPSNKNDLFGFSLYRAWYIRECNFHKLKSGCQLISIYYDIGCGKTITMKILGEVLIYFQRLLNLKEPNDSIKCAFQFSVKLKNDPRAKRKETKPLYSSMFRVVFDEKKYSVWTEKTDPSEYYIV